MAASRSTTKIVRLWIMTLFTVAVLVTLGGWVAGRDPAGLTFLLGTLATTIGIGEASNVGKRATFKPEAVDNRDS